jgi:hypothetical protein
MRSWTQRVFVLAAAMFCGTLFWAAESQAMPSFARQTGMNCNSCHIGFNPVPLFTRTGRIFSMRGYTRPNIREKMRNEGDTIEDLPQYGGEYLALNWNDFFAARLVTELVNGGKNNAGQKQDVVSNPLSRMAFFYTGPITDWLGLWTEIGYLGNNALNSVTTGLQGPTGLNFYAYDEYRLSAGFDLGPGTFFGMSFGNEHPDTVSQLNFPINYPDQWYYGQGGVGRSKNIANISFHGLVNDMFWLQLAFVTGAENNSWSNGSNQYAAFGYNHFRKTQNDLWFFAEYYGGQDFQSILTPTKNSYICPGTCPPGVTDSTLSITNTAGFTSQTVVGAPLEQVKDFNSYKLRVEWSAADLGPHTFWAGIAYNPMKENFVSGGKVERNVYGGLVRYFFKRTYGVELFWWDNAKYTYTTSAGLDRKVHTASNYGLQLYWVPAMNVSTNFVVRPHTQNAVFEDQTNLYQDKGSSYSLNIDFNF